MFKTSSDMLVKGFAVKRGANAALSLSLLLMLGAHRGVASLNNAPAPRNVSPVSMTQTVPASDSVANQPMELMHDLPAVAVEPTEPAVTLASDVIRPAKDSFTTGHVVWMQVTAYCGCKKCCGPHARGLTASGRSITYNDGHFVAADKAVFPFGTKLIIPGYAGGEPVEVIDRGSAIKGNHLDVFFPTHEEARAWGRQWIAVTVVE